MKKLSAKRKACTEQGRSVDKVPRSGLNLHLPRFREYQNMKGKLYMAIQVPIMNILVGGTPGNGVVSVSLKQKVKKT